MTDIRITSTRAANKGNGFCQHWENIHVVSKGNVTLGWIHEVEGDTRTIWNDYVGNMQFGNTPKFATIREALAAFAAI